MKGRKTLAPWSCVMKFLMCALRLHVYPMIPKFKAVFLGISTRR